TMTAVENLQQALMIDRTNDDALGELERISTEEGRFDDLLQTLHQQKDQAEPTAQPIAPHLRIAQVAGTHLGDTEMAIQSLQEVLAAQPDNRNALSVLANLYFQQGDYGRALELLNDMLAYAQNGAEQAAVLVRVARIMQQPGGDERQAEDALVQALQADPSNVDAIDSLLEIYEGRGEHESRLRVMEYKIATVEDPEERF